MYLFGCELTVEPHWNEKPVTIVAGTSGEQQVKEMVAWSSEM